MSEAIPVSLPDGEDEKDLTPPPADTPSTFDATHVESLQALVDQEVERRRKVGAFPPAFEKMLRSSFEKLIPQGGGTSREDFQSLFRSTDRSAFMDIDVPLLSRTPGVSLVKKIIRTLVAWYLNYLLQQLTNFTANLMQLLSAFDRRLRIIEDHLSNTRGQDNLSKGSLATSDKTAELVAGIALKSGGRIMVGNSTSTPVIFRLTSEGADCYGSDTDVEGLELAQQAGIDVRWSPLKEEISNIRPGSIQTLVIQGGFELEPISEIISTLKAAADALSGAGTLIITCHDPGTVPADAPSKVAIDLGIGKFLHRETWIALLKEIGGFGADAVTSDAESGEYVVVAKRLEPLGTETQEAQI